MTTISHSSIFHNKEKYLTLFDKYSVGSNFDWDIFAVSVPLDYHHQAFVSHCDTGGTVVFVKLSQRRTFKEIFWALWQLPFYCNWSNIKWLLLIKLMQIKLHFCKAPQWEQQRAERKTDVMLVTVLAINFLIRLSKCLFNKNKLASVSLHPLYAANDCLLGTHFTTSLCNISCFCSSKCFKNIWVDLWIIFYLYL